MILVALGSNLESPVHGAPQRVLEAALESMPACGISVVLRSSWYRSAPVPRSSQPWFVNGVAQIDTSMKPAELLACLHEIEFQFGRRRLARNESRVLDLDLLAYDRECPPEGSGLILPHPGIAERAFVLYPLVEMCPEWQHPVSGETAAEMLRGLPEGQQIERID